MTVQIGLDGRPKCWWCVGDPLYESYHDEHWGYPIHNDQQLFELLMLEGFQAGLSWITILRRQAEFTRAFRGWDPVEIAAYGDEDHARLLADPGIIRNRLKVLGTTRNAQAYLRVQESEGSFDSYLWSFVGGEPLVRIPRPDEMGQIPATTPESDLLSKDLKKRGFTFVGSTIVYAFMQSAGLVDDHLEGCWRTMPV